MILAAIFVHYNAYASVVDYIAPNREPTYANYGGVGYMMVPSANFSNAGTLAFTVTYGDMLRNGSIVATPYDWFEASYFYVSVQDTPYSINNSYLDKGFNAKVRVWKEGFLLDWAPQVAIGFRDLAGTGLATGEYIVATKNFDYFNVTLGLGWGSFWSQNNPDDWIKNPLGYLFDRYKERYSGYAGVGGVFNVDSWFTGPASPLFGLEIYLPYLKGTKLKISRDPTDYTENYIPENTYDAELRFKDSEFDVGLVFNPTKSVELTLSYERGKDTNVNFTFKPDFSKKSFVKRPKRRPYVKPDISKDNYGFYMGLLENLNRERLYLQSAEIKNKSLEVDIAHAKFVNPIEAAEETGKIISEFDHTKKIETIAINQFNGSFQQNRIIYDRRSFDKYFAGNSSKTELKINTDIDLPKNNANPLSKEFTPRVKFPGFSFGLGPGVRHHVGTPENFWNGNIYWRADLSVAFSRDLTFISSFHKNLYDTYDRLDRDGNSALPPVRTYIRNYLQESRENVTIEQLQLNYVKEIYPSLYARATAGVFETMFSGVGYEFLYKPYDSNLAIGWVEHKVRQRAFDGSLDLMDYEITTSHINAYYYEPYTGFQLHVSNGKYLAGDRGTTYKLSRRMKTGYTVGAYWSQSNVSWDDFGEGSFDKGIFFQIPIEYFYSYNRSGLLNFGIQPMTRDGQAKLGDGMMLYGTLINHSSKLLNAFWNDD